uniref:Adhesion G protein-coupled receptor G7, tandem duplicate 2 n=1 Tax=Fundulus heteroclitus TaxID=8078 RepID=A0A3Q2R0E9_FUNHE
DFACVFWDYNLRDWSTQGCSKGNASDNVLRCLCNHTTNFAALWSFRENYKYAEALGVISTVGLSFSLLGLVVTIIHHLKELHVEPDRGHCTPVAALLHFFLLATFSWNSVYGTQLVLTLAATYRVQNPLDYRQEECWLAALDGDKHFSFHKPMFWAFLLPLGLVLIYNTVLLVLTSLTTCRVDPR